MREASRRCELRGSGGNAPRMDSTENRQSGFPVIFVARFTCDSLSPSIYLSAIEGHCSLVVFKIVEEEIQSNTGLRRFLVDR